MEHPELFDTHPQNKNVGSPVTKKEICIESTARILFKNTMQHPHGVIKSATAASSVAITTILTEIQLNN